jgi:hypothetical protein
MAQRWLGLLAVVSRWLVVVTLAATASFAIERVRMVVLGQSELRWSAEWTLWSGHAIITMGVALLATLAIGVVRLVPARVRGGALRQAIAAALLACVPLVNTLRAAGDSLASGSWISEQSFAPLVVWAPLGVALVAAPVVMALALLSGPTVKRDRARLGLLVIGALAVAIVDHELAPGLYPEFHMQLHVVLAATLAALACRLLRAKREAFASIGGCVVGAFALLACVLAPMTWFDLSAYARAALVLRAPATGDWIRNALPQRPWTPLYYVLADLDVHAGEYTVEKPATETGSFHRDPAWNVIFIVADTLRADALPPSRPAEGTAFAHPDDTPRLDAWLDGAFRFEYAYTAATETKRAMPPMFRSIEASDDPITNGVPLGQRLEALGLDPVAVVHRYFMPAKYPPVAALFDGFGEVRVYENPTTDTAIPQALELAAARKDRQFAMFIHLYTVHLPGYDGKVLGGRGRVKNYRKALKYLDKQVGDLLDGLDALDLRERTLIVFVGDHGEGLGDHGVMLHGPTTFEEDVRVPLAFEVPGHAGRHIRETVGTVDFAPTLLDLLGAAPSPGDRGRSLVPLFIEEPQEPKRPYYFENNKGTTVGVVVERDKLIYEKGVDIAYRFDIAADPDELTDLHDPGSDVDRLLLETLVQFQPRVAAEELDDPATLDLLREHLREVDPRDPGAALPLLVRLVAIKPARDLVIRCGEIFDETDNVAVRLLLARHLLKRAPKTMTPRMVGWLETIAGQPVELEVASALARQGQAAFAVETIGGRMLEYATTGEPASWEPWLRLVAGWAKPAKHFAPALAKMLARVTAGEDVPDYLVVLVLENVVGLDGEDASREELGTLALRLVRDEGPRVRAAAVRGLGSLGDEKAADAIRERLLDTEEDIRVRRDAAASLTAVLDDAALVDLERVAGEVAMTTLVVRHLRDHGSAKAVPLLEKIKTTDKNGDTRIEAKKAIEQIRSRTKKAGKG